jgi:hypothetical protein
MWKANAKVIPVIIGANGTISKSLRPIPEQHTSKAQIQKLQKTATLGTAHMQWKIPM